MSIFLQGIAWGIAIGGVTMWLLLGRLIDQGIAGWTSALYGWHESNLLLAEIANALPESDGRED